MTAKQYRKGDVAVQYAIDDCSLGRCLVAESERGFAQYCSVTTMPN
jgi:AraC family transcriptional regulator of adaptative response/methylated-DNA-[protein]-cysteine methyltransferase